MKEAGLAIWRGNGWTVAAFTAVASAACGLLVLALGQDANYDQQNYHFYVPYALFEATQALNLSAGVSNCKVSRGRSFS